MVGTLNEWRMRMGTLCCIARYGNVRNDNTTLPIFLLRIWPLKSVHLDDVRLKVRQIFLFDAPPILLGRVFLIQCDARVRTRCLCVGTMRWIIGNRVKSR